MRWEHSQRILVLVSMLAWMLGGITTGRAAEWVLGNEPLEPSEILTTVDLYSLETALGSGKIPVKQTKVVVGRLRIHALASTKTATLDSAKWDFYLVGIPFDISEVPKDRYYERFEIHIVLSDPNFIAYDICPQRVDIKEDVEKIYWVAPEFKFREIELKVGEFIHKVTFSRLHPVIRTFGLGRNEFSWVYSSHENQSIVPESKYVVFILQVPKGTKFVAGNIHSKASIVIKKLFRQEPIDLEPSIVPILLELERKELRFPAKRGRY